MHITVYALGSQGDVRPYIALANGLAQAGFRVRMVTHDEFLPLIEGRGLEFRAVRGNPRDLLGQEDAHAMLATGENMLGFLRHFRSLLEPFFAQLTADCVRAGEGTDAVVLSNIGIISGFHLIAESMGTPYAIASLQPFLPTRAFPSAFFPEWPAWLPGRGAYNWWSHAAFVGLFRHFFRGVGPAVRRELGMPPISDREVARRERRITAPLLMGYSPSVLPRPADWPPFAEVTGYWFLDRAVGWEPSSELRDFLAAGPPPVYVGFGSMRERDPEATAALVTAALRRAGKRGILLTGWGGLRPGDLGDDILPLESTSHAWLLPRCHAVVHHGGAGTTAAGLRSGVPSLVVPYFADQPFWARTVSRQGAGPRPVPRKQLTSERLAEAFRQTDDPTLRARAAELGARIEAEDGVGQAVARLTRAFTP